MSGPIVTGAHKGHGHQKRAEPRSGTKKWQNHSERLAELYMAGAELSSIERAMAVEELAARERRLTSIPVVRGRDLTFEKTSWPGVEVAYVIDPHLGVEVRNFTLELHRIAPGAHTPPQRYLERVVHVLSGTGHSVLDGERFDWGPHDSFQIKMGAWHEHHNTGSEPVVLLIGKADIVAERLGLYVHEPLGDSFSDLPDDFRPEHPFTKELVDIGAYVGGAKWMSHHQMNSKQRSEAFAEELKRGRVMMKASEVMIERSEHKGDWRAALVDEAVGFHARLLAMYVQQLPPNCHTETHRHGEAIVYVLSGHGHSIVERKRYEWEAGDCIFIQPGTWHQHFNTDPKLYSQHLTVNISPLRIATIARMVIETAEEV